MTKEGNKFWIFGFSLLIIGLHFGCGGNSGITGTTTSTSGISDNSSSTTSTSTTTTLPGSSSGTITGQVIDITFNRPIVAGSVSREGSSLIMPTYADGRYTFYGVPPGITTIEASKEFYVPRSITVTVLPGQIVTAETLSLSIEADAEYLYPIYPNTNLAPQLIFYCTESKQTMSPPTFCSQNSRYGGWENTGRGGREMATETEIATTTTREPVYSMCPGTVVYASYEGISDYGQQYGVFSIRYGRKYVMKHHHITEIQPAISVGDTIEAGTLIGYTKKIYDGHDLRGFWEVEVEWLKATNECRSVPVYLFLDAASKSVFDQMAASTGYSWYHFTNESTIESFLPYVGVYEAWCANDRSGINPQINMYSENYEDYCTRYGLSWLIQ